MKSFKKSVIMMAAAISMSLAVFVTASALYGSDAVREGQTYTLPQMLTFAIEDEYLASARYMMDIREFGDHRPFARVAEAEKRHINMLKFLMKKYDVPVPEDRGARHLILPDSLLSAMKAGVIGEDNNKSMYDIFLKQQLPDDVRFTFTLLRSAAEHHLEAFKRQVSEMEKPVTAMIYR